VVFDQSLLQVCHLDWLILVFDRIKISETQDDLSQKLTAFPDD
jgi:hypothetical protein